MWNLSFGVAVLQLLLICLKDMHGSIGGQGPYPSLLEKTHLFNSYIKITKNKTPPILTLYKNVLDLRDKKVAFFMIGESLCVSKSDGLL